MRLNIHNVVKVVERFNVITDGGKPIIYREYTIKNIVEIYTWIINNDYELL